MKMKKMIVFVCAMAMFAATPASAALVLLNGGFESPVGTTQIIAGNTAGNWTAVNKASFIANAATFGALPAFEGDQMIQVDHAGPSDGRIFQLLGTTDGLVDVTLSASFAARDLNFDGTATYAFGLYSDAAGTIALAEKTGLANAAVNVWSADSVTATGVTPGTSVYAFFTANGVGSATTQLLHVDDVGLSVVATIPEPIALLLVSLGILGLGVARRRRQH